MHSFETTLTAAEQMYLHKKALAVSYTMNAICSCSTNSTAKSRNSNTHGGLKKWDSLVRLHALPRRAGIFAVSRFGHQRTDIISNSIVKLNFSRTHSKCLLLQKSISSYAHGTCWVVNASRSLVRGVREREESKAAGWWSSGLFYRIISCVALLWVNL